MSLLCACLFALCLVFPAHDGYTAEVTGLLVDKSSEKISLKYFLTGIQKEKHADIDVSVEINGTLFPSEQLTMSGDFGRNVAIGSTRIIQWSYREDFPDGLNGNVKFNVDIAKKKKQENGLKDRSESHKGLTPHRQTVMDRTGGLLWARNAKMERPMKFNEVLSFITNLNKKRFAGFNDWRLPEKRELENLLANGKKSGWGDRFSHYLSDYLNSNGFKDVQGGYYWSSTFSADGKGNIAVINMWNGAVRELEQNNYYSVLPVRSSK